MLMNRLKNAAAIGFFQRERHLKGRGDGSPGWKSRAIQASNKTRKGDRGDAQEHFVASGSA
jgi:hypothetical protein